MRKRDIQPGDKVKLTGKFLRNTGQYTGPEGLSTWIVEPCACARCAEGEWVAVNQPAICYCDVPCGPGAYPECKVAKRHFHRGNLFRKGTLHRDNA